MNSMHSGSGSGSGFGIIIFTANEQHSNIEKYNTMIELEYANSNKVQAKHTAHRAWWHKQRHNKRNRSENCTFNLNVQRLCGVCWSHI